MYHCRSLQVQMQIIYRHHCISNNFLCRSVFGLHVFHLIFSAFWCMALCVQCTCKAFFFFFARVTAWVGPKTTLAEQWDSKKTVKLWARKWKTELKRCYRALHNCSWVIILCWESSSHTSGPFIDVNLISLKRFKPRNLSYPPSSDFMPSPTSRAAVYIHICPDSYKVIGEDTKRFI